MTVLLLEKAKIWGEETEIRVFRPSGGLTREKRERAEALDTQLAKKVPIIATEVMNLPKDTPALEKWYQFGVALHELLDDNQLVAPTDLKSGLIWEAIKQHLPPEINLKGAGEVRERAAKHDGQRGHFAECYAIAEHAWGDVKWLKRWVDWTYIYYRESMRKDVRILKFLRHEIACLPEYPSKECFAEIIKSLAAQTTGKDISVLDDASIAAIVGAAVVV